MKRIYPFIALTLTLLFACRPSAHAQSVTTGLPSSASSGSGANYYLTFVIENNNSFAIIVDDIEMYRASGANGNTFTLFYNPTVLSGPPALPTGWNTITSVVLSSVSSTAIHPTFTNLNFSIPANTTYRFAVQTSGSALNYGGSANTPNYHTNAGVAIGNGNYQINNLNVGYWGGSTNPRFWCGTVIFHPAVPCTAPPVGGTATASASAACVNGTVDLNLTGATGGTGQTYQWQSGPSSTGPWTNVGPVLNTSAYTATVPGALWFRCALTCATQTAYSAPVQVLVNPNLPAGTYTINSALPTAGSNFNSFTDAVAALSCGIAGPVIFNVNASSGPYNEQITIPQILNSSATNTVTFNCNNRTLTYNTTGSNYAVLSLNGSDYVRIKKLVVVPSHASTGFGILLTNGADNNIIDSCKVDNGMTSTGTTKSGIEVGATFTSATASGGPCDNNIISNNEVIGGYYCMTSVGASGNLQQHNQFINNLVRDYYVYGLYMTYNNDHVVEGNEFHRLNRPTSSTFYGIVNTTGNLNATISKNRIHDPFANQPTSTSAGYFLYNSAAGTSGNENVISNNIVYNMQGNGTQYIIYSTGSYGRFYFNTISCDYTAATSGTTYGFYQSSASYVGIQFKNNIISLTRGGSGTRYCVYNTTASYPTLYDNNNYYVTGTSNKVGYTGTAQATLANWQSATSKDANSMSVNPNFVSANTGDLTPTNLAMDNIGTPIAGITTDITGFPRNAATPDAGAFEFNNCNPVTGLAVSAYTTTSVNISWNTVAGSLGYQYVVNQTAGNPSAPGTPTTNTSVPATGLTSATQYYAHVRNVCGPASFSPWVTIPFITCTQAVTTPGGTITFCAGDSIMLNANTGTSYQWKLNTNNIPGATTNHYTAMGAGNYTVTINSPNGCVSTSAPVVVQITSPASAITPASAAMVCPGSTTPLTAPSGAGYTYQWRLNGSPISGATAISYNAGTVGNYTVTVSSGPGCFATTATPTTLSLYTPPPATITPPANTAVCPGSMVTLNANTGAGLTYQWYLNSTSLGSATTNAVYSGPGVGNYTVKVTNTINGCSTTSAATTITQATAPVAQAMPVNTLVGCDTVLLTGNQGAGYTYQWLQGSTTVPGATNLVFAALSTGPYSVKVTGTNGCSTVSSPVSATVHASPLSTITYSSPLNFCFGGGVALNVYTSAGYSYQWYMNGSPMVNDTVASNIVTAAGSYSILVTNVYGCSRVSPVVQVVVNPLPTPVITRDGNMLSTGAYASYQWYMNNQPIPGANQQTYNSFANGVHAVAVTDSNGCQNVSPAIFVNNTGINRPGTSMSDIHVYPNPARNIVNIDAPVTVDISLSDVAGSTILRAKAAKTLDVSVLPKGVYMLRVQTEEGILLKVERIVKID